MPEETGGERRGGGVRDGEREGGARGVEKNDVIVKLKIKLTNLLFSLILCEES